MSSVEAGSSGTAVTGTPAVEARALRKSYRAGDGSELRILRGVELRVAPGEVVAIIGASGVGKSTLLHLLGALDRSTEGEVLLGGQSLAAMSALELAEIRNRHVGFVFQFHHLLREFSALENVAMPRRIAGRSGDDALGRAHELLEAVGLSERTDHLPTQLSGGEQQRVAVARALASDPLVLLADEPSGNLDGPTSQDLHDLLFRLREEEGTSMVLVTHNLELASRSDRVLRLKEGILHPWDGRAGNAQPGDLSGE
ncbi:MAG: ABC transporter ATP-binding protein [Longimicrobiales bacterium]